MWVDGIDIERLKENENCYLVNNSYLAITDMEGRIIFTFNLKNNGKNIENLNVDVAQKTIMRYDVIKKIQENIK